MRSGSNTTWSSIERPAWSKGDLEAVANRMHDSRRDYVVPGLVLLEHHPHGSHVIARKAPITLGIKMPEPQLALESELDRGGVPCDVAGDELQAAPRAFARLNRKAVVLRSPYDSR